MEALTLQTDVVAVSETGRRTNDAYFTPQALAHALVGKLHTDKWWRGGSILEPSAGRGAFAIAAAFLPYREAVHAVDADPIRIAELPKQVGAVDVIARCADFLDIEGSFNLIIGNPPYSGAEAHARHALSLRARHGVVAFLLRLAFLESQERQPFWSEHPASKIYVLSERPSFTGGKTDNSAYGFFVWANWHRGPTEMEVMSWR
jgi:hypothetical protein